MKNLILTTFAAAIIAAYFIVPQLLCSAIILTPKMIHIAADGAAMFGGALHGM